MSLSRRSILLASLGLLGSGCTPPSSNSRPATRWPGQTAPPRSAQGRDVTAPRPQQHADPQPTGSLDSQLNALPRSQWTSTGPRAGRVNPMGEIQRITVHHEGWIDFNETGEQATIQRLERIRNSHVNARGWGDIGYHYIIDRAGRLWSARPTRYQGAHVGGNNENNLGIMLLGNFDRQQPTAAQLSTLRSSVKTLLEHHSIPVARLYSHQELSPSACPGSNFQPRFVRMRSAGEFT